MAVAQASAVATAAGVVCGTSDDVPAEGQALEARLDKPAPDHFASTIPESELAAPVSHIDLVPAPPTPGKHHIADASDLPLGSFVVSVQRGGRFRRLHRLGDCPLRPGVDYSEFRALGCDEPSREQFTVRCKNCFGKAARGAVEDVAQSSNHESSSSTSGASSDLS